MGGAATAALETAIAALKSDADPKGTWFAPLRLKASKMKKTSIKVTWKKVRGARKYVVYANACGKKNKMMKVKTTTARSFTLKKLGGKKLKKGKYYKFMVAALDANGKVITVSKVIHAATKGGKVGNPRKVKVKVKSKKVKLKKGKKITLKKGKKYKFKGKIIPASKKKKVKKHRAVKYETSNPAIATVSSKGVVKAKKKGTCYIFVYAQNGVYVRIKVIVR